MVFNKLRALRRRHARDPQAGVTLIEMMVVLVIIAVVAAMVVPNVIGRPDQARATVAQSDLQSIAGALEIYRLDNRTYPSTAQGLEALVNRPSVPPEPVNWASDGYLSVMPKDPWGADYVYRFPGQSGRFDLISLGADGQPGGDGVDADIMFGDVQAANG
ncbi:type II secretion system major pseudopilin GspG [Marivita sp.]|uniref:type II secretion system major pseudopilin GspG n=1 Tax=Marivita sp. TaxID=2003365 RepID=UPI003F70682F